MPKNIGFATRRAPLACEPDLNPAQRSTVVAALRWAWAEVCQAHPSVVATGDEETVTQHLQDALNSLDAKSKRRAPGLDLFETVNRGAKVTSVSGTNGKAPDLVFRPPRARGIQNLSHWGLFVECKIIDDVAHHSPKMYCDNGVARYARGEYAARMRSAMLVAYVRNGRQPHPTLDRLLKGTYATLAHVVRGPNESISTHDRAACGCANIVLAHLWLPVVKPI